MTWNWHSATSWDAAGSGNNPLSLENYLSSFRWGNSATGGTEANYYLGRGYSVNRYVSMADFSTSGGTYTGRYAGAPNISSGVSDFNYRHNMDSENGGAYGRDT